MEVVFGMGYASWECWEDTPGREKQERAVVFVGRGTLGPEDGTADAGALDKK